MSESGRAISGLVKKFKMSQTTICYPVRKSSRKKTQNKSNAENESSVARKGIGNVKRALFDGHESPRKKNKVIEEICTVQENVFSTPKKSPIKLCKQNTRVFQEAKQVLHTSLPTHMVGRDKEIARISNFLRQQLDSKKSCSLYVSGAPGTGKTSCIMHVLKTTDTRYKLAFINCMAMNNPGLIYKHIADELSISTDGVKNVSKCIENFIVSSKVMNIIVLDEIDHLDSKDQEILYSLFSWPQLPNSSVILIGIANALDLTDRVLPRLKQFKFEPILMHFQPYTKDEIVSILEDRLSHAENGSAVLKATAIQLCARKVAACTGDIRKALDVCRRAIELTEKKTREQLVLKASADDRCNPGSPSKRSPSHKVVDLKEIAAVLNDVYGSRIMTSSSSKDKGVVTLPLQQAMVLCTLILMKKFSKNQNITLGKVYDVYKKIARKRQMGCVGESEFNALCQLIESRGFIELKKNKIVRMSRICLRVDEGEIEHVLQDRTLLSTILADKSVI